MILPKVDFICEDYSPLTLTLHVIDIKYYQVVSLLEDSPMDVEGCFRDEEEHSRLQLCYGCDLPSLYGIPPKFSPFHREFTERDFAYFRGYWSADEDHPPPPLDYIPILGELVLNERLVNTRLIDDDYSDEEDYEYEHDYEYKFHHPQKGVNFNFDDNDMSSVQWPHQVCSFLRALMKEKCPHIEPRGLWGSIVTQQPEWLQDDKILDTITSYASFEDQAGKLRLVCRQFGFSLEAARGEA